MDTCSNCESPVSSLTKIHLRTGKRGRPPIRFYCDSCLTSEAGTYLIPGAANVGQSANGNGNISREINPVDLGGFDSACLFLLTLIPDNLFSQYDSEGLRFRCKGCGAFLDRNERAEHYKTHRSILIPA